MELNDWIDSLAPRAASKVAAEQLKEKRRTVDSWRLFQNPPSFRAAVNITRVSRGQVDFNGIYAPYQRALEAEHGHD
ncbi:hypothetical protein [Pseudomonas iridis]|uniref:hypothetical protein n=1 Tax=Pseudomonas iridis TaxID=2710587 RepID=UPI001B31F238|nr:hypothetical protein [Pseudomonas iridis]MBP5971042.1 hypothetical protein [Pseudomonas iridis]